jgi:hypothetical protein
MQKKKTRLLVIILPYNKINTLIWAILSFKQKKYKTNIWERQKYGVVFGVRSSFDYSQ